MYLSPAQLIFSTAFGDTKPSKIEMVVYDTLSGAFDPMNAESLTTTLLDLSTFEPSGLTMFDVLAASYGFESSTFDLLSVYTG